MGYGNLLISSESYEKIDAWIEYYKVNGFDRQDDPAAPGADWGYFIQVCPLRSAGWATHLRLVGGDCDMQPTCTECWETLCIGCGDKCLIDLDAKTTICDNCLGEDNTVEDMIVDRLQRRKGGIWRIAGLKLRKKTRLATCLKACWCKVRHLPHPALTWPLR